MQYNLNTDKFKKYLAQRENNINAKEKLCSAFKDCAPDINVSNVFDKIADTFVIIIDNACGEPDGRCKKQTNYSESNTSIDNLNNKEDDHEEKPDNHSDPYDFPISVIDIPKIQEIIMDLSITAGKLFDLGESIYDMKCKYDYWDAKYMNPEIYEKFNNEYDRFVELNRKLKFYNSKYMNEALNNAAIKGVNLNKSSFINHCFNLLNKKLDYEVELECLSRELDEYQSE